MKASLDNTAAAFEEIMRNPWLLAKYPRFRDTVIAKTQGLADEMTTMYADMRYPNESQRARSILKLVGDLAKAFV
jgi:hypothetical protein